MDDTIIKFDNVSFGYSVEDSTQPKKIFEGFSLNIKKGEMLAIIGHNGSGKSTLARMMNGLYLPDSGKVTVNGIETSDEEHQFDIRRTVGVVFQNPDNQIVSTIVEEDVAFGPENLGVPPKEIRNRVDDALKTVGMYEYRTHATQKLSGGQKQRIAIAGVLAMLPECIVLDEPTAMLDPKGRREVIETVTRLNRERGITVVLITHFMDEAVDADRIMVMDKGKTVLEGTPLEVFSHEEEILQTGLELPSACILKSELKKAGLELPREVLTAGQCADALAEILKG